MEVRRLRVPPFEALDSLLPGRGPGDLQFRDTVARVLPYWHERVAPDLKAGRRVLIAAHGNSLRGLIKFLDGISDEKIVELEIPTGVPILYELDDALKPVKPRKMLTVDR